MDIIQIRESRLIGHSVRVISNEIHSSTMKSEQEETKSIKESLVHRESIVGIVVTDRPGVRNRRTRSLRMI